MWGYSLWDLLRFIPHIYTPTGGGRAGSTPMIKSNLLRLGFAKIALAYLTYDIMKPRRVYQWLEKEHRAGRAVSLIE